MIAGEAGVTVTATPGEVLDLICDLGRYRLADTKIRTVLVAGGGPDSEVRFRSRLRGLPTPAVRQRVVRTGDERVDIASVPGWQDRLVGFRGSLTATPTAGGALTRVVHREELHAHGPLRPVVEWYLRDWLARDVAAEVARLAQLLGPAPAAGGRQP